MFFVHDTWRMDFDQTSQGTKIPHFHIFIWKKIVFDMYIIKSFRYKIVIF